MPKTVPSLGDFLVSRTPERNKHQPRPKLMPSDLSDLAQLIHMFPDIDRAYARMCLQKYTQSRVASVTEKLLDKNFSNYPRHVLILPRTSLNY